MSPASPVHLAESPELGDDRLPVHFWAKVETSPAPAHAPELGECWLWTASKTDAGYGHFGDSGRIRIAHVVAYERLVAPVPVGLQLDHLCRRQSCVRPSHLEPVTSAENNRRSRLARGLDKECGKGHPLTPENTHHKPDGERVCVPCRTALRNKAYARMTSLPDLEWLPIGEAAALAGLTTTQMRNLLQSGEVAGEQVQHSNGRRRWLAQADSVRTYLRKVAA